MAALNYKHLYYFWVVAKTGGVTRAAERLHVTAQTISGQIGVFENVLGFALFERAGRGLEPTEAGRIVLGYADAIFRLGAELEDELRNRPHGPTPRFRAGIADVMPKSMAYGLLDSVSHRPDSPRIVCREGTLDSLLADLAVHRLDIVLADRPMPGNLAVRGYSHLLGECGLTFFATAKRSGPVRPATTGESDSSNISVSSTTRWAALLKASISRIVGRSDLRSSSSARVSARFSAICRPPSRRR
jgi:LysR family transcriptional activator of nhaA